MSLAISTDHVTSVLLADGWHEVASMEDGRSSFDLDSYEFHQGRLCVHGGGNSGVCSTGFTFTTPQGDTLIGPLTAILAVKTRPEPSSDDDEALD